MAKQQTPEPPQKGSRMQGSRIPPGRRGVLFHASDEAWEAVKILGIRKRRSLQEMMVEALNDFLTKNGAPPVA